MSRRRRRVKIKSSSRLFAFILFNLLLLASCVSAHYLQEQPQFSSHELQISNPFNGQKPSEQHQQVYQAATQGISTTTSAAKDQPARGASILSTSQQVDFQDQQKEHASNQAAEDQEDGDTADESPPQEVVAASHQYHQQQQKIQQQQQQLHNSGAELPSVSYLCAQLPLATAKHLKLCKLIGQSPNADTTVTSGAARGLAECRNQFKSSRWNCTHASGDHHLLTSNLAQSVGNRESGFVQAIAAAGIVHSIATACSSGSLSDCACDKTRVGLIRQKDNIWKWGGCSNNIRHGMMFAKHLVELLDTVHEHARHQQLQLQLQMQQQQQQSFPSPPSHLLYKRQLKRLRTEQNQNQVRARSSNQLESALLAPPQAGAELLQQQQQQMQNFCQKNQNISQSTQIQLIKSLLSKNSLERHQDFRLAMNMHNNRVGRMAVAKNMEIKCRCHGLSGSCSLKTCWLKLPDFQQIGAYLKRKYDGSIHLPTAVNVNRLIPMMDRQEISAILLQSNQEHEQHAAALSNQVAPEFAALTSGGGSEKQSPDQAESAPNLTASVHSTTVSPHFNYYERHKQLERLATTPTAGSAKLPTGPLQTSSDHNHNNNSNQTMTSLFLHGDETPINIVPMSQQQYQSLLRDMKLCNNYSSNANGQLMRKSTTIGQQQHLLQKRELNSFASAGDQLRLSARQHLQSQHKSPQRHHHHHISERRAQHSSKHHSSHKRLHHSHDHANQQQQQDDPALVSRRRQQQAHHQHHQLIGQLLNSSSRDDLVHLHKSPDYCEADPRHGFAGVRERTCSPNPFASNSCDRLCCGRGHETRLIQIKHECDCKFQYCCMIVCKDCHKEVVEHVCK